MNEKNLGLTCKLPSTLTELFVTVIHKGQISQADRCGLRAAVLNDSLTEEEKDLINRLLYAVRRGWLRMAEVR